MVGYTSLEYKRKWQEAHRHPCLDCGKPCGKYSLRCPECRSKCRRKEHQSCIDCGALLSKRTALRCRSCASKISNAPRKIKKPSCIECGATLSTRTSLRCGACFRKFIKTRSGHLQTGKFLTSQGYVMVRRLGHPRANKRGYVLEHIIILEEKLGRPLKVDEIGHHLNGIREDNRPENLVAMTRTGHRKHEMGEMYKKRIRQLEREFSELKNGRRRLL